MRVSALRTLGAYANVFAIESFMDELAAAAGVDPVAFRLAHLKDPRARAVIEAAAKKADWKAGRDGRRHARPRHRFRQVQDTRHLCRGRGRGRDRSRQRPGTRAARVRRGRCRSDHQSRRAHQPDRGRHRPIDQLDAARRRCASTRRGILARDWESYPILTMPEAPKVEVELIDRPNERPLGAGEASQGPTAAADRQCLRERHRQAHPRPAAQSGAGQSSVGLAGRPALEWASCPLLATRREKNHGHQLHCERQGGLE